MKKIYWLSVSVGLLVLSLGCTSLSKRPAWAGESSWQSVEARAHQARVNAFGEKAILEKTQKAADRLSAQLKGRGLLSNYRYAVTSVADIDRLETSSTAGRMISEHLASRLAQNGFEVTEIRMRWELFVSDGSQPGEFMLSRNLNKTEKEHVVDAVVAGTYAVGQTETLVSIRAIDLRTHRILASADYTIPNVETFLAADNSH